MAGERPAGNTPQWPAIAALLLCAALWSLNGPLIKLLNGSGVHGVTIASYRSLIGGLVFLPIALRQRGTTRSVRSAWLVASVLTFTLMTATFVIANTMTAAANAIILQYTSAIWVFLLSPWLLKERPGRAEGLVLLIAMAGIGVIFSGNPDTSPAGLLVALASGLGYGLLTMVLRGLRPVAPATVAALNGLGSGLLLLPWVAAAGGLWLTRYQLGLIVLMGLVQFTLPYVIFSWALQRVPALTAALITLLETVLNPLWTFLIVREVPPVATLMGGPLILAGVGGWLVLARRARRSAAAQSATQGP